MKASKSNPQQEKVYAYKLIKFIDESDDNTDFDFVPEKWVHYDPELEDICTRFMPPPYNPKNSAVLHTMIKTKISPPDSWPKYRIEIRGEAQTHADAVKKVQTLREEEFAFLTENEENSKERSLAAKKSYLIKLKPTDSAKVEKLMNVPPLPDDDGGTRLVTQHADSSSDSSIDSTLKRKRQRHISSDSASTDKRSERLQSSSGRDFTNREPDDVSNSSTPQPSTIKGNNSGKTLKTKQVEVAGVDNATSPNPQVSDTPVSIVSVTSQRGMNSVQLDEDDTEMSIQRCLRSLSIQQTKTTEAILGLKKVMESINKKLDLHQVGNAVEVQRREVTLAEKLQLTFPVQSEEDFERFDSSLLDPAMLELLRKEMSYLIEIKLPLQRNIGNILKKYMARDLLRSYTAVKKIAGKKVLKSTNIYQRLRENITSEYGKDPKNSPISDKKFGDAVGAAINSAKDWDGNRLLRANKSSQVPKESSPTEETATGVSASEKSDINGALSTKESTVENTKQN